MSRASPLPPPPEDGSLSRGVGDLAARWIYIGVWAVLVELLRVPNQPPMLPAHAGVPVRTFRPCAGWLRYRKVVFWILVLIFDTGMAGGWLALYTNRSTPALMLILLALPWLAVMLVPPMIGYLAIHLAYDTTWYVLSDRSMRLRHGVWVIQETTITFANIQNVEINQGPLQRFFGFSDVIVKTAGGRGGGPPGHAQSDAHLGLLRGIEDAHGLRELIMDRVRRSRSAGLGDEHPHDPAYHDDARALDAAPGSPRGGASRPAWTGEHLAALRRIRDEVRAMRQEA